MSAVHAELILEYRNQNWKKAETLVSKARKAGGEKFDGLYDLFDRRIEEYKANSPGLDWDGVFVATDK
jgi:hypothetical protein